MMGLITFALGMCCGFYLRNTRLGADLGNRLYLLRKMLKDGRISNYKLVLIVREDLNMGRGKIASQCSHASVLAYKSALSHNPDVVNLWEVFGQGKIILRVNNEKVMLEITNAARKVGLLTNIVCDAGRTEVQSGSKTVVAIGPGDKDVIDKITGHLKLL